MKHGVLQGPRRVDAWITACFALMLTGKGMGEAMFSITAMAAIVLLWREPWLATVRVHRLMWIALAIASITLYKTASLAWAIDVPAAIRNVGTHLHFVFWLPLVVLFTRAQAPLDAMMRGLHWSAALLVVWLLVHATRYGLQLPPLVGDARFEGGAQNPGVFGQLATVSALWLVASACMHFRAATAASALLMVVTVVLASGRSHLLALALGLFCVLASALWMRGRAVFRAKTSAWLMLPVAIIMSALLAITPAFEQALQEFTAYARLAYSSESTVPAPAANDIQRVVGNSVGNRAALYDIAAEAFPDSPLVGFGAGSTPAVVKQYAPAAAQFMSPGHFHQQYIHVALEGGLLGAALALMALLCVTRWFAHHRASHRQVWWNYLALIGTYAAVGLFTGVLQQGLIHAFTVMALAALAAEVMRDQR